MKSGDVVTIYENPLTCKKREGEAKLIDKYHDGGDSEYWLVEFVISKEQVGRWIKKSP